MFRKIYSILIIALLCFNSSQAQSNSTSASEFQNIFTFGWDVNIPMGDKYVEDVSFAGGKMEYRKMIKPNLSVGFDVTWNSFSTYKSYQTYHVNASTDVTTDLYKYNYTLPLAITAHYYFNSNGIFIPYAGLGLGATFSEPKLYYNIYEISRENWGFLMRPEIGTIIKFNQTADMGLMVGARYSYSTNSEDIFNIKNLQSLGFNLGLVWMY